MLFIIQRKINWNNNFVSLTQSVFKQINVAQKFAEF